eukprot:10105302-Alexandrium_andersonii.AAC.1
MDVRRVHVLGPDRHPSTRGCSRGRSSGRRCSCLSSSGQTRSTPTASTCRCSRAVGRARANQSPAQARRGCRKFAERPFARRGLSVERGVPAQRSPRRRKVC